MPLSLVYLLLRNAIPVVLVIIIVVINEIAVFVIFHNRLFLHCKVKNKTVIVNGGLL